MTSANSTKEMICWYWRSDDNPWFESELAKWTSYSDIQNQIIEEAYASKKEYAYLSDYYIDLKQNVQISSKDKNKQRPVKREINYMNPTEIRFVNPLESPKLDTQLKPGAFGTFIWEAHLVGKWRGVEREILVERAATGIIEEGKLQHKQYEAEEIANMLLEVKKGTRIEIWGRCVYLYSRDSFLYKSLNATMRMVGFKEHEETWRSKLKTLGLFAWFLFDFPQNSSVFNGALYRGGNMNPEQVEVYKKLAASNELCSFSSFMATTKRKAGIEKVGNVMFIISIASCGTTAEISSLSEYPGEEEVLIIPGFLFRVKNIEFCHKKKKTIIYLEDCNNEQNVSTAKK